MPSESLVQRYRDQLQKLLPPGRALNRRLDSFLTEWLEAFSVEFARVHERVNNLLTEAYPGDASELLTDWESLVGLPDNCSYGATSDAQRQSDILTHFAVTEGQNLADFQSIASARGYDSLTMGTYGTFRTGVHPIGHKPVYSDEWLYGSRVNYKVMDPADTLADSALECKLVQHAHIHTQMNFNSYDPAPVASLTGIEGHFIPNAFVLSTGAIFEWTNQVIGPDFTRAVDANSPIPRTTAGFAGLGGWNETTDAPAYLGGINIRNDGNEDAATLLKTGNVTIFMVVHLDQMIAGLNSVLMKNVGETWKVFASGTVGAYKINVVRGATTYQRDLTTSTFVLTYADNGTNVYMQINGGALGTQAVGSGVVEGVAFLGDNAPGGFDTSFHGAILELIACDYIGVPGSTAAVDDVTNYLVAKYL